MFGWTGNILRVDLTSGRAVTESASPDLLRSYVGVTGLAAKYWADECPADTEPLAAENRIVIMTGPLTGLLGPCTNRCAVIAGSPVTGRPGGGSFGGHFGAALKLAGFDGVIIEGKSDSPVFIRIANGQALILPAGEVWGRNVDETTAWLEARCAPGAGTLCIGRASEALSPLGVPVSDRIYAAGNGGIGAVFGSKGLKGIAVIGTGELRAARPEEYARASRDARRAVLDTPFSVALGSASSEMALDLAVNIRQRPADGYRQGSRNADWDGESPVTPVVGRRSCCSCPVGCRKVFRAGGSLMEGPAPEYGDVFRRTFGIHDTETQLTAHELCRQYGMDPVAAASAAAGPAEGLIGRLERLGSGAAADASALPTGSPYDVIPALDTADPSLRAFAEACGVCPLTAGALSIDQVTELWSAATGLPVTGDEILAAGERIRALLSGAKPDGAGDGRKGA